MSAICARLSPKEVGVKRVETLVSTLLPRRGARHVPALRRAQLPAESQRKTLRPSGANTPAAVRVPRSAGAEKEPPGKGFIRWSYATSLTEIDKGLDRLEAFIKNA